jgi:hypothetical protein
LRGLALDLQCAGDDVPELSAYRPMFRFRGALKRGAETGVKPKGKLTAPAFALSLSPFCRRHKYLRGSNDDRGSKLRRVRRMRQ